MYNNAYYNHTFVKLNLIASQGLGATRCCARLATPDTWPFERKHSEHVSFPEVI